MNAPAIVPAPLIQLKQAWSERWPEALALWSRFTRLSDPIWCYTQQQAEQEGLTESFAMIRLSDQAVVINLPLILQYGVQNYALEVLAHEIGHHIYCPADLADHARLLVRVRRALPTKEQHANLIANLYTDLLINDRLQRSAGLSVVNVYQVLNRQQHGDRLWTLYMRIYELLWALPRGTMAQIENAAPSSQPAQAEDSPKATPKNKNKKERMVDTALSLADILEGDAILGSRIIRSYARDWVRGGGRFATLCLPYLLENEGQGAGQALKGWYDTRSAGAGADAPPAGLSEVEEDELDSSLHPANDPRISGMPTPDSKKAAATRGQARQPYEYGQILKALGMDLSDHEVAVRYYRERALPHLIRYPTRSTPQSSDPLPEGMEPWDIGSPIEDVDWLESVLSSPCIIPNLTTLQRHWGVSDGAQPHREALDLDLYIDSSGSMPNPQVSQSYLALAGTIIALSALRAGARIQATLWSGAGQFDTTHGFIRDEKTILRVITGYISGGTAFPIHILRDTFSERRPIDRPVHILVISDEGLDTMFEKDERGASGWDISRMALEKARGGGTFALNLYRPWDQYPVLCSASEQGWAIYRVGDWKDLIAFARDFSTRNYENAHGS